MDTRAAIAKHDAKEREEGEETDTRFCLVFFPALNCKT